jgi:hypothetical protein
VFKKLLCDLQLLQYQFTLHKKDGYSTYSGPCSRAAQNELHCGPKKEVITPKGGRGQETGPKQALPPCPWCQSGGNFFWGGSVNWYCTTQIKHPIAVKPITPSFSLNLVILDCLLSIIISRPCRTSADISELNSAFRKIPVCFCFRDDTSVTSAHSQAKARHSIRTRLIVIGCTAWPDLA